MKPKTCVVCGIAYVPKSWNSTMTPICSDRCKKQQREAKKKKTLLSCVECGTPVLCQGCAGLAQARRGRAYCSNQCKKEYLSRLSAATMAKTNRKYASERMRKNNPMKRPEVRAKVSRRLKEIGWRPLVQGGNGRGPTAAQKRLGDALRWPLEIAIPTKKRRGTEYPTCYKVDIANPILRIAIDVDGRSHCPLKRQKQDQKKDNFLRGLGWTVLRFRNNQVMEDLAGCVQTVMSTILRLQKTTTTTQKAC